MAKLSDFITSRVRSKLLSVFFSEPGGMLYVRELTREIKEEINAVRRELLHLQESGIVKSEKRGNRLYYRLNHSYLFAPELTGIVGKTTGLGHEVIKFGSKLGFIKYAFMSTRIIKGGVRKDDQIDLMLIGDIILPQLAILVKAYEAKKTMEVNYSVMTEEEFNYRKNHRDPFILSVLYYPRIMLIGTEENLLG